MAGQQSRWRTAVRDVIFAAHEQRKLGNGRRSTRYIFGFICQSEVNCALLSSWSYRCLCASRGWCYGFRNLARS